MSFLDAIFGSKNDDEPLDAQWKAIAPLLPLWGKSVTLHKACDEIANARGAFGHSETNPIPVNGIEGEMVYLFRLKAKSGATVFYHRLGSVKKTNQQNETVDVFEVVACDGSQWAVLYFSIYFPRRSIKCPEGFDLRRWSSLDQNAKQLCKLPCFGSFHQVKTFPIGLPEAVESDHALNSAMPGLGASCAGNIRELLSQNKGSWQRSENQVNKLRDMQLSGFMIMKADGSIVTVEKDQAPPKQAPVRQGTARHLPPSQCPQCRMLDEKGTIILPKLPKSELDPLFTHVTIHWLRRLGDIDEKMFKKLLELVDRNSESYKKTFSKYKNYARAEGVFRGLSGFELEDFICDYIDEESVAIIFENWHRNGDAPKTKDASQAKRSLDRPISEKKGLEVAIDILQGRFAKTKR